MESFKAEAAPEDRAQVNVLEWWRAKSFKYPLLSKAARNILVVHGVMPSTSNFLTGANKEATSMLNFCHYNWNFSTCHNYDVNEELLAKKAAAKAKKNLAAEALSEEMDVDLPTSAVETEARGYQPNVQSQQPSNQVLTEDQHTAPADAVSAAEVTGEFQPEPTVQPADQLQPAVQPLAPAPAGAQDEENHPAGQAPTEEDPTSTCSN